MKRVGGLFEEVADARTITLAAWRAARGKRQRPEVREFLDRLGEETGWLVRALRNGSFRFGRYRTFTIRDPKSRVIHAPPFPDRVVHHALLIHAGPVFERGAVAHSYACRAGRGQHAALRRVRSWMGSGDWFLKLDVAKFYDNVEHGILRTLLARRFREGRLLDLFDHLLDSHFASPGKGLPIGALTSQYLGNFYLDRFDHWVNQTCHIHRYARYMDDLLFIGGEESLRAVRSSSAATLAELGLKIKGGGILNRCVFGAPFLGFVVYPDRIRLNRLGADVFAAVGRDWNEAGKTPKSGSGSCKRGRKPCSPMRGLATILAGAGWWPTFHELGRRKDQTRVLRGGSWNNNARNCRSAYRNRNRPDDRNRNNGFRVCLVRGTEALAAGRRVFPRPVWPGRNRREPAARRHPPSGGEGARRGNFESNRMTTHLLKWSDEGVAMAFRLIPAGTFRMGGRGNYHDEEPVHEVEILEPFWMGETPVTQAQFALWTRAEGLRHENYFVGRPDHPAENMDWREAVSFCDWLTRTKLGECPEGFRLACLPTEAEWEYACRAGTETEYYNGDGEAALADAGWYEGNSGSETHPIRQKAPNGFGLYDMHGNVLERCHDLWDEGAYRDRVDGDPDPGSQAREAAWRSGLAAMISSDRTRVLRGGSWYYFARVCRSACRVGVGPGVRYGSGGFRVCLVRGPAGQTDSRAEKASGDEGRGTRPESDGAGGVDPAAPDLAQANFPREAGSRKL